jgi:hypothetical protein
MLLAMIKPSNSFNVPTFYHYATYGLLAEDNPLWKLVLKAKYGFVGRPVLSIGRLNKASLWWRDLVGLGVVSGVAGDWLENIFIHSIGDGGDTNFWHHHWCALGSLADAFPRLFRILLQPDAFIKDMGEWVSGSWIWNLKWRRPFFFLGRGSFSGAPPFVGCGSYFESFTFLELSVWHRWSILRQGQLCFFVLFVGSSYLFVSTSLWCYP